MDSSPLHSRGRAQLRPSAAQQCAVSARFPASHALQRCMAAASLRPAPWPAATPLCGCSGCAVCTLHPPTWAGDAELLQPALRTQLLTALAALCEAVVGEELGTALPLQVRQVEGSWEGERLEGAG